MISLNLKMFDCRLQIRPDLLPELSAGMCGGQGRVPLGGDVGGTFVRRGLVVNEDIEEALWSVTSDDCKGRLAIC